MVANNEMDVYSIFSPLALSTGTSLVNMTRSLEALLSSYAPHSGSLSDDDHWSGNDEVEDKIRYFNQCVGRLERCKRKRPHGSPLEGDQEQALPPTRRSSRQASRASDARKPWHALMKRSRRSTTSISKHDEDKRVVCPGSLTRHRTTGEVEVQVFRRVLSRDTVDLLLKGELFSSAAPISSRRASHCARNPWPGVNNLIKTLLESTHAMQVKHPYIAEISSRCDSTGPPQRLDLRLSSSGVRSLLSDEAIQAVEAIVFGLRSALKFTGKVHWDSHVVVVLPGAPEQRYHVDSSRSWFYFTLIFPLSKDPPRAGRTEFWNKERDQPSMPVERGDVLVFDGKRKHRGSANATHRHVRVFLYIAVYSGTDWN